MYHEYIDRLAKMIEELPKENYYMRNLFKYKTSWKMSYFGLCRRLQ